MTYRRNRLRSSARMFRVYMMAASLFLAALLALLLAPGPTNTLMGLAGAQRGLHHVIRLIPAEVAGYLTTILPLTWLGAALWKQWPTGVALLEILAALWILHLAIGLWKPTSRSEASADVTGRKVYVTTVLNPKALVFGLVLLPPATDTQFTIRLAMFCLMVIAMALIWGTAGSAIRIARNRHGPAIFQRAASVWLTVISITLAARALHA